MSDQTKAEDMAALQEAERKASESLSTIKDQFVFTRQQLKNATEEIKNLSEELESAARALVKSDRSAERLIQERMRALERLYSTQSSITYKLGEALLLAARPSLDTLKLPFRLAALFRRALRKWRTGEDPVEAEALLQAHQFAGNRLAAEHRRADAGGLFSIDTKTSVAEVVNRAPSTPHLGLGIELRTLDIPKPPAGELIHAGAILDEFSASSFSPEFNLVTFRPDNWAHVLQKSGIEMLLVESAWHGNDDAWQYRIASYQQNMGDELSDLLACCKHNGIPTVFWNKEDPVHFDRFIEKAKLFDVVLTTDSRCIPRYCGQVGHDRVFALPFAAQPRINNPIQTEPRVNKPCFAGTYYASRHEQRRDDMTILLLPAMRFDLDIYDRMHGATGKQQDQFRFPDEFQPAIRGRLEYTDMVKAYKRYRVFLNVNSVKESPTMFSRRVFELLACGTPVISTYSKGVEELLGPNGVFITHSEGETREHLEMLLNNPQAWSQASALGIKKVLMEHTYAHRARQIGEWAGLARPEKKKPRIAVIVPVDLETDFNRLAALLKRLKYPNYQVTLFARPGIAQNRLDKVSNAVKGHAVWIWNMSESPEKSCAGFLDATDADIVAALHEDALYADDYLDEVSMFFSIPDVDFLGKGCHFRLKENGQIELAGEEKENRMAREAPSASMAVRKSKLTPEIVSRLVTSKVFATPEDRIFSSYRYSFLELPSRNARTDSREWRLRPL